jgi:hypothetical protein
VVFKAFTPIKFLAHREVVPLEAQARAGYASVQMPPTITDGMPSRAFGERRRDAKFGRSRLQFDALWVQARRQCAKLCTAGKHLLAYGAKMFDASNR